MGSRLANTFSYITWGMWDVGSDHQKQRSWLCALSNTPPLPRSGSRGAGSVTQTPAAPSRINGGELSTEQVPGDTPNPDMALVRWRIICIVRNMERFSEGLRSPLLFWECILVPAELINYKPNILLATTLQTIHISLATSTQLCCQMGYLYGCMG